MGVVQTDKHFWAVGSTKLSPIPTNARVKNNGPIVVRNTIIIVKMLLSLVSDVLVAVGSMPSIDNGVQNVANDHKAIPILNIVREEYNEVKTPAGTIIKPYPKLKKDDTDPFIVSVNKLGNSFDIGTNATLIATRSNADKNAIKNNNNNITFFSVRILVSVIVVLAVESIDPATAIEVSVINTTGSVLTLSE